jgi:hypothetical protein
MSTVYKVWRRLHEYPSNNKLSKIMKLLIKRLFLGRASPKTKITIHFIVNIGFSKVCYSKDIHVNVFKLCIPTNFEVVFLVIWFIS